MAFPAAPPYTRFRPTALETPPGPFRRIDILKQSMRSWFPMAGLVGIAESHIDDIDPLLKLRKLWPHGLPIIRPMYHMPIFVPKGKETEWKMARFGISRQFSSFNARSENLTASRMWSRLFGKSHGVAPLSYIVEWRQEPKGRVPYLIQRKDGKLLMTPALIAPCFDDKKDLGFAICTRTPNEFFSHFHDRMVGVLDADTMERWLDPAGKPFEKLLECVRAPEEDELVAYRANEEVGKRKAEDLSPIPTVGKALTIADFVEMKGKGGKKQTSL